MHRLTLRRVAREHGLVINDRMEIQDIVLALRRADRLPTTDEFFRLAEQLHVTYTTELAVSRAAHGREPPRFPRAAKPWTSANPEPTIVDILDATAAGETQARAAKQSGDQSLAMAKSFMRETIRSREMVWAVAQGDVGRAWEQLMYLLFSFAGSTHNKYAQYVLEMMCNLLYESTPELRHALLASLIANPSGRPGKHHACDQLQEYLQRILEAIVQHKGAEFGQKFIRHAIAPNLALLQDLKNVMPMGVGLGERSKRRHKPGTDGEMGILLKLFAHEDVAVHEYKEGRTYLGKTVYKTQFQKGREKLDGGLLKKWTTRAMLMRDEDPNDASAAAYTDDEQVDGQGDMEEEGGTAQPYTTQVDANGGVAVEEVDTDAIARLVIQAMLADEDGLDEDEDDEDELPDNPWEAHWPDDGE